MEKPHQQIEWVPIVFILAACYIVTLLVFSKGVGDAAMQIGGGIATTFGGAAAGAYGSKLVQNRNAASRATDVQAGPTQPQPEQQETAA